MKIEIISEVRGGKLVRNRKLITETIKQFEGKTIVLSIEKQTKKRSTLQNAYLHASFTILTKGLNELGNKFSMSEVKELVKAKFLMIDMIDQSTGEVLGKRIKGTSELTTTEMMEFIMEMQQWAAEFEIMIPNPNEQIKFI